MIVLKKISRQQIDIKPFSLVDKSQMFNHFHLDFMKWELKK